VTLRVCPKGSKERGNGHLLDLRHCLTARRAAVPPGARLGPGPGEVRPLGDIEFSINTTTRRHPFRNRRVFPSSRPFRTDRRSTPIMMNAK